MTYNDCSWLHKLVRTLTAKQFYKEYFSQCNVVIALLLTMLTVYFHIASKQSVCDTWPNCSIEPNSTFDLTEPNNFFSYLLTGLLSAALFLFAVTSAWQKQQSSKRIIVASLLLILTAIHFMAAHVNVYLRYDPLFATGHIALGLLITGCVWWLSLLLQDTTPQPVSAELSLLRPWAVIAITLLIIEIMLGIWTSAFTASLIYHDIPNNTSIWMNGQKFINLPVNNGFIQKIYLNIPFLLAKVNSQMLHRFAAYLMTAFMVPFALCLLLINGKYNLQSLGAFLLSVVALQFALGIISALFEAQIETHTLLAILHTAMSGILLLTMSTIIYRLFRTD